MKLEKGSKLVISGKQLSKMGIELVLPNYASEEFEEETRLFVTCWNACNFTSTAALEEGQVERLLDLLESLDKNIPNFGAIVKEFNSLYENN